jgi:metal-responsive CopG/Arc/MetJ family transcriptional regulator
MTTKPVTVSLDKKTLKELDERRGDVTRSKFVERLLETALAQKETDRPKENDQGPQRG